MNDKWDILKSCGKPCNAMHPRLRMVSVGCAEYSSMEMGEVRIREKWSSTPPEVAIGGYVWWKPDPCVGSSPTLSISIVPRAI